MVTESDLESRQDPVLFDKFEQTPAAWYNRLLGVDINTRHLAVQTPAEYVTNAVNVLTDKWHPGKGTFIISDSESITGVLGYIAETSPWLRFMMSFLHTSIARALKAAKLYLIHNSRDFRVMLKAAKKELKNMAVPSPGPCRKPAQRDTEL